MKDKNLFNLVLCGVLCAIGIVIPMFMPKIVLGPMSFTLASHVAIFLAMFVSPSLVIAVCVGTTIGFFLTTPLIIAIRAASHIIFAIFGAFLILKNPNWLLKPSKIVLLNILLALVHAVGEVVVVSPLFLTGSIFKPAQLADGYMLSVICLVGVGTFIHSLIDFSIAICLWKPIKASLPALNKLK